MEQALTIALAVQEAEKQESFNESFYTRFDNSVGLLSRSPSRECHEDNNPRRSADTHAVNHVRAQRYKSPRSTSKPLTSDTMNSQTQTAIRCYECEGLEHFARKCLTMLNTESNPSHSLGKRNPIVRLGISRSPGDKTHSDKTGS
jgi:hypothetical protein